MVKTLEREPKAESGLEQHDFRGEAKRKKNGELRAVFEDALDAMAVLDDRRKILDVNRAACVLFGATKRELRGSTFDELFPEMKEPELERNWAGFLKEGVCRGEQEIPLSHGAFRTIEFTAKANCIPGRHLLCMRDVTLQKHTEESLRLLSRRLMKLQDEERRRIARELHDSTGQYLTSVRINLALLSQETVSLSPRAQKALQDAGDVIDRCAAEVRTLSYLLHPPMLDEAGLAAALRWCVDGFAERSGIRTELEIPDTLDGLPLDLGTAIYRIVQESLANIHRHSGSSTAHIRLIREDGRLTLVVCDHGNGIPADIIRRGPAGVQNLGVGLAGMRERVSQLGGDLQILRAHPGTIVRAIFPLEVEYAKATLAHCG